MKSNGKETLTVADLDARTAVLIPCFNEEESIAKVVTDFRQTLPDAAIYVYDNNSTDRTSDLARRAGAIVRTERAQGKGNVVRRMFSDIEADIYVIVDGDGTYDAASAQALINALITEHMDMVIGTRLHSSKDLFRRGHRFGNKLLTRTVGFLFGKKIIDMLSGYRAMTRRFVKSFPALSRGFETETELTIHALSMKVPILEIETPYYERYGGTASKLSTYKDGLRILKMIIYFFKEIRPALFFTLIFAILVLFSIGFGIPLLIEYIKTGLVPRLPTAVLSASLMLLAFLSLTCGIILDSVKGGRWEAKRLAYLAQPSPFALRHKDP